MNLDKYIQERRESGAFDSEGQFSVSGQEALTKLAEFQLPFAGGWALKLVQAAVCAGEAEQLKWLMTTSGTEFHFAFPSKLGVKRIESAFSDPYPQPEPALNHLITGLRAVGLNEKRPFMLETPAGRSLIWDGQQMTRGECGVPPETFRLEVSMRSLEDEPKLFMRYQKQAARRHAEVTRILSERAFACPIPLELDGRRLDALELSPGHGYGPRSQPLALMVCSSPKLEPLPIPDGTRTRVYWSRYPIYQPVRDSAALTPKLPSEVQVAILVSLHTQLHQEKNSPRWEPATGRSHCYWVLDGVLVDQKPLEEAAAACSVGCFLNAEGLKTDLSSLTLRDSPMARARLKVARSLVKESLESFRWDQEAFVREQASQVRQTGIGATLAGVAALWVSPLLGVVVTGLGVSLIHYSRDAGKERGQEIKMAVEDLLARF